MLTTDDAHALARRRCATRSPSSRCGTGRWSCSRAASPGASRWHRSTPWPTCWRSSSWPCATTGTSCGCRAGGRCARAGPFVKASAHAGRAGRARRPTSASTPRGARRARRRRDAATPRRDEPRPRRRVGRRLPLDGVKVADFSWIGVGPITAKALADHGATVVHVENDSPADRLRLVGPFKDDIAGINRCQFFGSFNTSKLSLQLDLKHPVGNDVARQLLAWCDVALDSFTAGTMAELGLGYEVARSLNPDIIMATTCLMGQYGPAAELAGYGYHAAAVSGFYEITGWDDRPPAGPFNAYTDTIAPRFLATTLLAALDHRRRTGEGQFIDQAQMESALHFLGPAAARRAGVRASARAETATTTRPPPRTTPTRAPASTSGAPSPSRPTSSGRRCARRSASRRGRWTRRSTPPPAGAPGRELIDRELGAFTAPPRAARADGAAAGGGRAGRDGAALERPPARPAAGPPRRSSAASSTRRWARCPYEGHQFRSPATTTARASRRRASASTPTRCSPRCSAWTTTRSRGVLASGACG